MFFEKVYKVVRQVPQGKVVTYGQVAKALDTRDARKVGWALHANKDTKTPCHRVVNQSGGVAKNFGFGGGEEQKLRLQKEGVKFTEHGRVEMIKYQYEISGGFRQPWNKV